MSASISVLVLVQCLFVLLLDRKIIMIIISSSIISISITLLLILKFSGCSYCELSFASTLVTIILLALIAAPL